MDEFTFPRTIHELTCTFVSSWNFSKNWKFRTLNKKGLIYLYFQIWINTEFEVLIAIAAQAVFFPYFADSRSVSATELDKGLDVILGGCKFGFAT